ncbi:ubiquitin regulatory protein [Cryptosporidium felis]|nr:ubiquitin regulatory protein [Cryptosporidium felis]
MIELSEEKSNSLAIFCEVTGSETLHARTILESANWNLEEAVALYYEEQNLNAVEVPHVVQPEGSGDYTEERVGSLSTQNSAPYEKKRIFNRLSKFFRVLTTACGATLNLFFGFFKAIFYIPNANNVVGGTENRVEISHIERAQIEEARRIREEQDLEYMRSLNLDSIKQERAIEKQRSKDLIKERRRKFAQELLQVKEVEKENCSRVCVKNLEGRRFQRNFHKDDRVYDIFKWIDSLGLEEANMISEKFTLRLPHSKSIEIDESFSNNEVTIDEIGFFPSVLLLINNIEDDHEDSS